VPGIDLMLFGPLDLAMAMGGLDLMGGAQHSAALRKVHEACNLAGVPVATPATTREAIREALGEGYNAILVGSDLSLLLSGAEDILTCAREESGQSSK